MNKKGTINSYEISFKREQLAEELENMRKSLELQLKEHNRLKQEAINNEDFQVETESAIQLIF